MRCPRWAGESIVKGLSRREGYPWSPVESPLIGQSSAPWPCPRLPGPPFSRSERSAAAPVPVAVPCAGADGRVWSPSDRLQPSVRVVLAPSTVRCERSEDNPKVKIHPDPSRPRAKDYRGASSGLLIVFACSRPLELSFARSCTDARTSTPPTRPSSPTAIAVWSAVDGIDKRETTTMAEVFVRGLPFDLYGPVSPPPPPVVHLSHLRDHRPRATATYRPAP